MNAIKKIKNGIEIFAKSWGEFVVKFKWPVLIVTLIVAFGLASGAGKLEFDGDYHVFFNEENPELKAFDDLQDKYTKDDNILIVLAPKNGDVFTKENLTAIEELTAEAWNTPFSSRVDAITNYQHTKAVGDDLYVDDLSYETSNKTESEIAEVKKIALKEPLLVNRLINEKGSVTAINVTVKLPGKELTEIPETSAFAREMVSKFLEKYPNFDVYMSGMVLMNTAFFESSESDMTTLIPIMFLIVIITVFILTRSLSSTFSTLIVMILSIVTAMGAAGYLGIKLTPPSSVAPTIILTLAVADSIHIIVTMLMEMKKGLSKKDAIIESIRLNFNPVLLTSLSTIIGFVAMNFGDVPPFWDLGNITAIGMTAAFVYSLTILPALLLILPVRVKIKPASSVTVNWYEKLGKYVSKRPKQLAISSFAVILIFGVIAQKNVFNDEFIKYFDHSIKFRTDTDYISDNLTGMYTVEFSVPADESGGINEPKYLNKLNEFEIWLKQQPEVVHVNSYLEVAKKVNKSMHGDDLAYYEVPTSRDEAAQYLLLYEMSLPFGLDLNNQINVDKSETRVTVTTENLQSPDLIAFSKRSEKWLADNTPKYMHTLGTSPTLMFSNLGFRQAASMLNGNIIAGILITVLLIFSLKSLKLGLISIIPNLAPVIIGFGVWALVSGMINTGMVVVFGMTLGIVVDDTIHFMSKYIRARREYNYSATEAVEYAFTTVGKALVTTTIVLLAGFAVLSQSSFGLNNGMARITTIIILSALLIDFILLPSLLILTSRKKQNNNLKLNNYENK